MSVLKELFVLSQFFMLIVPSIVVVIGALLIRGDDQEQLVRRRLLLLIVTASLSLVLLVFLIWTNPYGRELSSSVTAFGMLPVLIALFVLILRKPQEIARLWTTDKALLVFLLLCSLVSFTLLWLAERSTFYIVVILSVALASIWWLGARSGRIFLTALSLVTAGVLIITSGYVPQLERPAWVWTAMRIGSSLAVLLSIFLSAALLYAGLRTEQHPRWRSFAWRLILVSLLLGASAYLVFWDGIWSAAHARAFEDHLPFSQFLLSLVAGLLLALSLRGWRRLAGPLFVLLVITVSTLALNWGWNISAFKLTESRAARIETSLNQFFLDNNQYPSRLAELTPRYSLYVPPPVVVRQGSWCYQGGDWGYRLGYVSGHFTYFEAEFYTEIYAQSGEIPLEGWNCEQLIDKFEAGELVY